MTDRRPPNQPPPLPPNAPRAPQPYRPQQQMQAQRPPQPPRRADPREGRADRRAVPARAGMGILGYVGIGLVGLAVVAGAGIGYLMLNPPVDLIREQLSAQVKAKTGRELTISGPARFTLYPAVGITLSNVELSAPPAMGGRPLVSMAALDVSVKLMPLFGRRIEVDRVVLRDPVIEFRTDKAGRRSWDFAPARGAALDGNGPGARRIELAQAATPGRATDAAPAVIPQRSPLQGLEQVAVKDVRISNGTLNWIDDRTGTRETATAVNLDAAMPAVSAPLTLAGNLAWKGEKLDIKGTLTSVETMLSEQPAKLAVSVSNRLASLGFDGTLAVQAMPEAVGALNFESTDMAGLARLAGASLPPALTNGPGSITGKLSTRGPATSLDGATITLGAITATGSVGVEQGPARPLVRANLKLAALDIDSLLASGPATRATPSPGPAPKSAAPGAGAPGSIEDLLSRPGPQVKGFTQRAGWSEEPMQLAALGAVDADVKLQVAKLSYEDIKIGPSRVAAILKDSVLRATLEDSELYSGRGKGALTLDGTAAVPRVALSFNGDGISALPFLTDAARMKWLAGNAKVVLNVAGQGSSQKQLMESLGGTADLTFTNGAIVGWNIPQIFRGLRQGQLGGFDRVETSKTDFSELASTWSIAQGVAQNQDLRMTSPLLRVTGAGRVMLGARQIDYQLKPKVVASLDGQGGAQGIGGLEIPLRVKGPWEKPEIAPEVGAILKDPEKAIGAIKEIGKQFKGKKPEEIVNQVLGGDPNSAKKANDLLGKFLKSKKEAAPAQ